MQSSRLDPNVPGERDHAPGKAPPVEAMAGDSARNSGERRHAILAVAERHFLEHGFARTSMSDIRAEIGGSKSTLWNYFCSKEDLFAAVMSEAMDRTIKDIILMAKDHGDARTSLEIFCRKYIETITSREAIALHRLAINESYRFPDFNRTLYRDSVEAVWQSIADFLIRIFPRNEEIAKDPMAAAELLASLCHGRSFLRCIYEVGDRPDGNAIRQDCEIAVTTFLRLFGVDDTGNP